jgi:hypothetical protein
MCGGAGCDQSGTEFAPTADARVFLLETSKRCHHRCTPYDSNTLQSSHRAYLFNPEAAEGHPRVLVAIQRWSVRVRHTQFCEPAA